MSGLLSNLLHIINKYTQHTKYTYHNVHRFLSSKEIGLPKTTLNHDILLNHLKHASNTQNLMDIISLHHKIMNSKHLMQAFRSLFYLQKGDRVSTNNITSHPAFKTLCLSLKTNLRSIEINDLIESLKIISYVGVQSNSTIVQIILQMIRQNVNNLSLQQIIFLDFLLKQFKSTPLSDALLIALPIVFDAQLPMKIDPYNLSQLTDFLQFATKNKLSEATINLLMNTILKNKDMNSKSAISIIWSICDLQPNELYAPLLKKCLAVAVKSGDSLSILDLETILTKLTYRYNKKYQFYYNKEFFNYVANHVVINDLGFQQAIWILRKFSKVGYSHNPLLDYISTFVHNDKQLVSNTDSWNVFNLVTGCAITDYRPVYWDSIKQAILENNNLLQEERNKIEWVTFATRLAILNICIPHIIKKAMQETYISNLINKSTYPCLESFLILYQSLSTLYSEYSNLLPDISYVQKAVKELYLSDKEDKMRPLQSGLIKGFGGESYVLTNVFTKLGHFLHHVIIMRKGGYPVALNNIERKRFLILEDLEIPTDSHIITIYGCDSSYYRTDNTIFRTIYSLMFRTIEASGYSVIPISLDMWSNLLDHEKIPYLMQTIRNKNEQFEQLIAMQ